MATHITGTSAVTIGPITPGVAVRGIRVTNNSALTGTITVVDGNGVVAIITNPGVGSSFLYDGLLSPVTVTASAIGDITVSSFDKRN